MSIPDVVQAIASVLPIRRPITHHEPSLGPREASYVADAQKHLGDYRYINRFEDKLREVCGVEQAVAVSSGTCALHLALLAVGVKPRDEVILPSLTFAACANAVCHAGAVPHFIDSAFNLKPYKLRQYLASLRKNTNPKTGRRIGAVIAVHLLGIPADMVGLETICHAFGVPLVEDAAEALGSRIGDRACGSFGAVSILSFNNNKIVTTNGGGAVLTNDPVIAATAWNLATTARIPHPWLVEHSHVAYNYRMGDINAALGLAQIERLDEFLDKKSKLGRSYSSALRGVGGISVGVDRREDNHTSDISSNNWLVPLTLDGIDRDELLKALHKEGILARALFTPLHRLPMYQDNPRSDNVMHSADGAWNRIICLPSGADLYIDSPAR